MEAETRDWRLGVKTAESSREGEASGGAGSGALWCWDAVYSSLLIICW